MAEPEEDPIIPTNAEDAKRFKAMASVESTTTPSNDEDTPSANVNQEALGKAMADLSVTNAKKPAAAAAAKTPALKVNQEDVSLIVEQMEVTKVKATELLRAHGGSVTETLKAMILAS